MVNGAPIWAGDEYIVFVYIYKYIYEYMNMCVRPLFLQSGVLESANK